MKQAQISSGGVIYYDGRVLLIHERERNEFLLPKGHVKEGESLEEAATREVYEETGYKVKVLSKIGVTEYDFDWEGKRCHKIQHNYLLELLDGERALNTQEDYEDLDILWLSFGDAIEKATYEDTKITLKKARTMIRKINLDVL